MYLSLPTLLKDFGTLSFHLDEEKHNVTQDSTGRHRGVTTAMCLPDVEDMSLFILHSEPVSLKLIFLLHINMFSVCDQSFNSCHKFTLAKSHWLCFQTGFSQLSNSSHNFLKDLSVSTKTVALGAFEKKLLCMVDEIFGSWSWYMSVCVTAALLLTDSCLRGSGRRT